MSLLAKRSRGTAAFWVVVLAGSAAGMFSGQALAGGTAVSDRALAGWVDKRVQEWQLRAGERRFDEIGWAKTICEAERLAKQHGRPVFLFTYDGHMEIGRC